MDRAAVPPERRTDRTHTGAAGALLLPQLLARARHFTAGLGLVRAARAGPPDTAGPLRRSGLVDLGAEHVVGEIERADFLIFKIDNIDSRHGSYLFALRTRT